MRGGLEREVFISTGNLSSFCCYGEESIPDFKTTRSSLKVLSTVVLHSCKKATRMCIDCCVFNTGYVQFSCNMVREQRIRTPYTFQPVIKTDSQKHEKLIIEPLINEKAMCLYSKISVSGDLSKHKTLITAFMRAMESMGTSKSLTQGPRFCCHHSLELPFILVFPLPWHTPSAVCHICLFLLFESRAYCSDNNGYSSPASFDFIFMTSKQANHTQVNPFLFVRVRNFSGFIVKKEGEQKLILIILLLQDDPLVLNEIREDLRVECSKFGQIKKLLLFDVSS